MTTHSPVAQVEVEAKMRKIEAEIDDLKETIKGYENDYKQATGEDKKGLRQMIIAKEGRLHDLYEHERIKLEQIKQSGMNAGES
jgi:rubrerythrin